MGSFFEELDEMDATNLLDDTLKKQVDYPWPKEAEVLERHGLDKSGSILDIGTGNGYFLCRLAQRYPDKHFTGVELSRDLADMAAGSVRESGLTNVDIIQGSCPTDRCVGEYDFVLARFALYCSPDRSRVLRWAYDLLSEGGRLVVIDVDDGAIRAYPDDKILHKVFADLRNTRPAGEIDRFIGGKLPSMLRVAGFKDIQFDVRAWYSNFEMEKEEFADLFRSYALLARKCAGDAFTEDDMHAYDKWIEGVLSSDSGESIAMIPMHVASGTK